MEVPSSQAPKHIPWQWEWKDPQWTPCCSVGKSPSKIGKVVQAAALSSEEVTQMKISSNHPCVLSVALLGHPSLEILLEVLEVGGPPQPQRVLLSKGLRWPESIYANKKSKNLLDHLFPLFQIREDETDDNQDLLPEDNNSSGMVSATLCRSPLQKDDEATVKDVVDLMSFGVGITEKTTTVERSTQKEPHGPLRLVCLSEKGEVFVYDPIRLLMGLQPVAAGDDNDLQLASTFFFGQDLFENLEDTWKPLAEPLTKIHLSLFQHKGRKKESKPTNKDSDQTVISNAASEALDRALEIQAKLDETMTRLPYLMNPLLEASTLQNRTIQNQPTQITMVGTSLVVIGRGTRIDMDDTRSSTGSSITSFKSPILDTIDDHDELDEDPRPSTIRNNDENDGNQLSVTDPLEATEDLLDCVESKDNDNAVPGGFVTVVSTARWSETRTLFLPFVPQSVSHVSEWNGMELMWVLGKSESLLIRMDDRVGPIPVSLGDASWERSMRGNQWFASPQDDDDESMRNLLEDLSPLHVKKFQILQVNSEVPNPSILPRLLCASHSGVSPPSIVEFYNETSGPSPQPGLVLLKSLGYCTPQGTVVLKHAPSHVAKIALDQDAMYVWAHQGQGWSLIGTQHKLQFVCWEGSTLLQGAFVKEMTQDLPGGTIACPTRILPLPKRSRDRAAPKEDKQTSSLDFSATVTPTEEATGRRVSSPTPTQRKKNDSLLKPISSWSHLENTLTDGVAYDEHEPVLLLRTVTTESPHHLLSLRKVVVQNGTTSPFPQVLAWLTERENYFVAAGIALDLLQDADSLYHLWKHAEMIDEEDEETKLLGLLDGITPVRLMEEDIDASKQGKHSVTATHLAEMTVGCLIKGGFSMSKTLVRFLQTNKLYDPARVSLMLSHATIDAFSKETQGFDESLLWPIECLLTIGSQRDYLQEALELLNETLPNELRHRKSDRDNVVGPSLSLTKKLIQMVLESGPAALGILMSFSDSESRVGYWESLDHQTRMDLSFLQIDVSFPFLRHPEVRAWMREELELCFQQTSTLPSIWLQELCVACLQNANCTWRGLTKYNSGELHPVPSATSDVSETTVVTGSVRRPFEGYNYDDGDSGIYAIRYENETTRSTLLHSIERGSRIDFNLLIAGLLLLENRGDHWCSSVEDSKKSELVCTQSLLNATCYLAGQPIVLVDAETSESTVDEEPYLFFDFDSKSAMKQCFQAKNVVAGANLIGGRNGFILHVCDAIHNGTGMAIADAESFLMDDELKLPKTSSGESKSEQPPSFELTVGHQTLLLLLEEHVLRMESSQTFDAIHTRCKVDPVFAARSILRAWLLLSLGNEATTSSWLEDWLGRRLDLCVVPRAAANETTPRSQSRNFAGFEENVKAIHHGRVSSTGGNHQQRLACASLVRSLLWPRNERTPNPTEGEEEIETFSATPLASLMKFEERFILELCQSCIGLIESVPPTVLERIRV